MNTTADYYQILGVSPSATPEEIKHAFRKLALETHPDRNPGNKEAEERFKKINEAYGVLIDPQKRAQYDLFRKRGYASGQQRTYQGAGFHYTQEDIFRDFFQSRYARDIFSELYNEFERRGFRFDENFINNLFFGGRGAFFGEILFGGPGGFRVFRFGNQPQGGSSSHAQRAYYGQSAAERRVDVAHRGKDFPFSLGSIIKKAGRKLGRFLADKLLGLGEPGLIEQDPRTGDVTYQLEIDMKRALMGGQVEVKIPHLARSKKVVVKIPPGVKAGTKLRLKKMGKPNSVGSGRGDLFLRIKIA